MKSCYFVFGLIIFFTISCGNGEDKEKLEAKGNLVNSDIIEQSEGYSLLKNYCYACHSVSTKSHDDIIAPPLVAIKRRYKSYYLTKEAFIDGISKWVSDPKEENALMRGAVSQFKVMPKLFYKASDIEKIAFYIYENELEKPVWFETHFNNEHPNGMKGRMGKGRGRRMNRNNF